MAGGVGAGGVNAPRYPIYARSGVRCVEFHIVIFMVICGVVHGSIRIGSVSSCS